MDVISCESPLFFGERWQQAAFSIEVLYFYGVSKQIYYFMSSSKDLYSLLKAYERLNIISLVPWAVPNIAEVNSRQQLYMRDQMAAVNDCYQRYREAADFIIIHDMDDLIFMPHGQKYYDQFSSLYRIHQDAAFLHYASYVTSLQASQISEKFNMEDTLRSVRIGAVKGLGKTVFDPKRTKSVWIHHPHFFPPELKPYEVPSNNGLILHTRTWNIEEEETYETPYFKFSGVNKYFQNISELLSKKEIQNISLSWYNHYKFFKDSGYLENLISTNHYQKQIDRCIKSIGGIGAPVIGCRTVYACKIKPIKDFVCIQSKQRWERVYGGLEAYLPIGEPELEEKMNGCTIE